MEYPSQSERSRCRLPSPNAARPAKPPAPARAKRRAAQPSLRFDASNWNAPRTATVRCLPDDDAPGLLFEPAAGLQLAESGAAGAYSPRLRFAFADATLALGATLAIDLRGVFWAPNSDALAYTARYLNPSAVEASVSGSQLRLRAAGLGAALASSADARSFSERKAAG